MQLHDRENDLQPRHGESRTADDLRMQQVHERLDVVSRSLEELRARREAAQRLGAEARSREAARNSIDVANTKLAEIQAELDGLRLAMQNRALIEQAKGMLMLRLRVDEDQAFDYLRTMSNKTNRKLVDVASDVVRTRAGEDVL